MTALHSKAIFSAAFSLLALAHCLEPTAALAEDKPVVFTGCIGQTLQNCMASVSRYIPEVSDPKEPDFSPDVQGKIPTRGQGQFFAVSSDSLRLLYRFILDFGVKQRVTTVRVFISGVVELHARTEAQYEATGIYQAICGAARRDCPKPMEAFYKFFDANTRGELSLSKERSIKYSRSFDYIDKSKPFRLCGLSVRFSILRLTHEQPSIMLELNAGSGEGAFSTR